jgi:exosortase A-associated hydrolase 2
MTETPLYFRNGAHALFGIFHQPEGVSGRVPFVFCHAFGEEKLWAQRVSVTFARQLAAIGHPVLRFDYMGNGDSEGAFGDSSLTTALSDVRCAIAEVRRRTGARSVSLLGLRLGATIASLAAEQEAREQRTGIEHLVLWSPIVDGGRYMQELLRINLTTQMATFKEIRHDREALVAMLTAGKAVNVDGYELTHPLYAEVSAVKLASERKRYDGPCLIVQIDRQPGRPSAELQQLAATYPQAIVSCVQEEPFWKEILRFYDKAPNLFAGTLEWLAGVHANLRH